MNKIQQKYTVFMESVCKQFSCPEMLPALNAGFKAFCEASDTLMEGTGYDRRITALDYPNSSRTSRRVEDAMEFSDNPNVGKQRLQWANEWGDRDHLFKTRKNLSNYMNKLLSQRIGNADLHVELDNTGVWDSEAFNVIYKGSCIGAFKSPAEFVWWGSTFDKNHTGLNYISIPDMLERERQKAEKNHYRYYFEDDIFYRVAKAYAETGTIPLKIAGLFEGEFTARNCTPEECCDLIARDMQKFDAGLNLPSPEQFTRISATEL